VLSLRGVRANGKLRGITAALGLSLILDFCLNLELLVFRIVLRGRSEIVRGRRD
jgi:hypothetical protein